MCLVNYLPQQKLPGLCPSHGRLPLDPQPQSARSFFEIIVSPAQPEHSDDQQTHGHQNCGNVSCHNEKTDEQNTLPIGSVLDNHQACVLELADNFRSLLGTESTPDTVWAAAAAGSRIADSVVTAVNVLADEADRTVTQQNLNTTSVAALS